MAKRYGQRCPVAKSLDVLGDRWTLLLVRDLLPGTRRFQDLARSLSGIPPNLLSDRLKRMERARLVVRRLYTEHPPRAEYALTPKGQELGLVVGALAAWGSRHLHRRTALVHAGCGHEVQLRYFCPTCGSRVSGRAVGLARRPTARQSPSASRARRASASGSPEVSRRTTSGSSAGGS